jgi:nucleotide-binding universal stress UspA family protein
MGFRKTLIAVDNSAVAAHAADVGLELARSLGGEVAFIHAIDPSLENAPESGVPPETLRAMAEQDTRRLLAAFTERSNLTPPPLEFLPLGKPGAEIVKAAHDWSADVIVIGSHGRGGATRLLMGSVAEWVMRHSPPNLVKCGPAGTA